VQRSCLLFDIGNGPVPLILFYHIQFYEMSLTTSFIDLRGKASPRSSLRPAMNTVAPSFANSRADARPMPPVPPVINATLCSSLTVRALTSGFLKPKLGQPCHKDIRGAVNVVKYDSVYGCLLMARRVISLQRRSCVAFGAEADIARIL
jgi:hypothetical protein